MARKRMIDPEFWLDEELSKLSAHARLLYIGLWNICDDNYATFPNMPGWIKIQIFPYENIAIQGLLDELSASNKIVPFEDNAKKYYFLKNFFKYQRIDRPSLPKYPKFRDSSTSTRPEVKEVKLIKLNKQTFENSDRPIKGLTKLREDLKLKGIIKK